MADYITRIRTESGDLQIDYNALANKPDDIIEGINNNINALKTVKVSTTTKINGKSLSGNITLTSSDVGAASAEHGHDIGSINGIVPISQGGTDANNGQDGIKNLLAQGAMILSQHQYGDRTPTILDSEKEKMIGRIFFVRVAKE